MKTKTYELTGAALDWAVAKAEGKNSFAWAYYVDEETELPHSVDDDADGQCEWKPSTDWAQGGPIIEREGLGLEYDREWVYDTAYQAIVDALEGKTK